MPRLSVPRLVISRYSDACCLTALNPKTLNPLAMQKQRRPLHVAAKQGHYPIVVELLDHNVEISPEDEVLACHFPFSVRR